MDLEKEIDRICNFIVKQTNPFNGGVIGLSGGIDSALVAYLAVRALGKEKVFGMCLPYGTQSNEHGMLVASSLGIGVCIVNIQPMVDAFLVGDERPLTKGNLMARVRMCCLYMKANELNKLVIGTTNKSEFEVGYFTKWGDGAVDLEPIAHLYKTEVWKMAEILGVPDCIINKAPSAELWANQTDEGELGFSYHTLDKYLRGESVDLNAVERIQKLRKSSEHKRHMPPNLL